MSIFDCLPVAATVLTPVAVSSLSGVGYLVYKHGWKFAAKYVLRLPFMIGGVLMAAYGHWITRALAVTTALAGTIHAASQAASTKQGWIHVLSVFVEEVYRETLSAAGLISSGFSDLTVFASQSGVCGQLTSLDQLAMGLFSIWRGASIIIVILTLTGLYYNWKNKNFGGDEKVLVVVAVFAVTALINLGAADLGVVNAVQNALEFFDVVSSGIEGNTSTVNESVNQSLNQSG